MSECISGPCEGLAHAGVTDLSSYRAAHLKAKGPLVKEISDPQAAYINHGRWVVNCATCKGAGLTSRNLKISCCFDCGSVYTHVTFPRNAPQIEATLLKRSDPATRNWIPGETLRHLTDDNTAHGV